MTKKALYTATLLSAAAVSLWAAVTYNQNITAIFGSGNPNTGWTADTTNDLQLALRAKNRDTGATTNTAGTYTFANAASTINPARASWNYEFSINSDVAGADPLATYDYYLSVDGDPSECISYTTIDPLTYWQDNSFGTNSTANGQGVEGPGCRVRRHEQHRAEFAEHRVWRPDRLSGRRAGADCRTRPTTTSSMRSEGHRPERRQDRLSGHHGGGGQRWRGL